MLLLDPSEMPQQITDDPCDFHLDEWEGVVEAEQYFIEHVTAKRLPFGGAE